VISEGSFNRYRAQLAGTLTAKPASTQLHTSAFVDLGSMMALPPTLSVWNCGSTSWPALP